MKELTVEVKAGEIYLKCPDHGLVRYFGTYANLSDITLSEHNHSILHMRETHDLTQKG